MLAPAPGKFVTPAIRLVRELGFGGMGRVWVADHLALHAKVAVKLLPPELTHDSSAASRFAREAVAAYEVRSPHVVEMLDYGVSDEGAPYLVMELLEGSDLSALLARQRRLPPGVAAHIVMQVASALGVAHERSVIHRDVKPSNIFLLERGGDRAFVKVLDFGIAKTSSPNATATASGVALGTVHYMSPEQVVAKPLDQRTDIWSLGVVAFEMLTGYVPFDCASPGALAMALHTRPFPRASAHSPGLGRAMDEWFDQACAREPSQRFSSMADAAAAFERACASVSAARVVLVDADARATEATVAGAQKISAHQGKLGECIRPLPEPLVPLQRVRSTLLSASLLSLEKRGLLDAYFGALPAKHHEAIRSLVVGDWLPLEAAVAHYRAADALGLNPLELVAMGREVAARVNGVFLATLSARVARGLGVDAWTLLRHVHRAWERAFDGSAVTVWKINDREARVEVHGWPLAQFGYNRHALRGILGATMEILLRVKPYVQLLPAQATDTSLSFRVAWS